MTQIKKFTAPTQDKEGRFTLELPPRSSCVGVGAEQGRIVLFILSDDWNAPVEPHTYQAVAIGQDFDGQTTTLLGLAYPVNADETFAVLAN